jgi:hypothetical protein
MSVVCIKSSTLTGPGRFEWVCSGLSILLLPRLPEVGDWVNTELSLVSGLVGDSIMEGVRRCVSTIAPASKSPPISLQTRQDSTFVHPPFRTIRKSTNLGRHGSHAISGRTYLIQLPGPVKNPLKLLHFSSIRTFIIISAIRNIIFSSLYLWFCPVLSSL